MLASTIFSFTPTASNLRAWGPTAHEILTPRILHEISKDAASLRARPGPSARGKTIAAAGDHGTWRAAKFSPAARVVQVHVSAIPRPFDQRTHAAPKIGRSYTLPCVSRLCCTPCCTCHPTPTQDVSPHSFARPSLRLPRLLPAVSTPWADTGGAHRAYSTSATSTLATPHLPSVFPSRQSGVSSQCRLVRTMLMLCRTYVGRAYKRGGARVGYLTASEGTRLAKVFSFLALVVVTITQSPGEEGGTPPPHKPYS